VGDNRAVLQHEGVTALQGWSSHGLTAFSLYFSLHLNGHFSRWTWVSQYQNVFILDFIGAKDDGGSGDNWSYKTC